MTLAKEKFIFRWVVRGLLLMFLGGAVFLWMNRQLLDDNLYSLRRGQADALLELGKLSPDLTEQGVKSLVRNVPLRCDPMGAEHRQLGDRVCDSDIHSFNGIRALRIAFFFRDGKLAKLKVDIPGWLHREGTRSLLRNFGWPDGIQDKPFAGVRLVGWNLPLASVFYNRDADNNPLMWNSIFWVSHAEESVYGGGWKPSDRPKWERPNVWDMAYRVYQVVTGRI